MVNKKFLMGILVMALVFGMSVVSCSDDTTTVEGNVGLNYARAPQVSSVTVTQTGNKQYFIVSWDAVAGDVNSYSVYFKQDGKNSYTIGGYAQNFSKYDPTTGEEIPNDDLDKWSVRISSLSNLAPAAGSYCFGVRTTLASNVVASTPSEIKWSASFPVTAPQTTVSLTKNTDGTTFTASWSAIDGVSNYDVVLYYRANSSSSWNQSYYPNNVTGTTATFSPYSSGDYYVAVTPYFTTSDISVLSIASKSSVITK